MPLWNEREWCIESKGADERKKWNEMHKLMLDEVKGEMKLREGFGKNEAKKWKNGRTQEVVHWVVDLLGKKGEIYLYFNTNDNFKSSSCKLFKTLSLFFCRNFIV